MRTGKQALHLLHMEGHLRTPPNDAVLVRTAVRLLCVVPPARPRCGRELCRMATGLRRVYRCDARALSPVGISVSLYLRNSVPAAGAPGLSHLQSRSPCISAILVPSLFFTIWRVCTARDSDICAPAFRSLRDLVLLYRFCAFPV